MYIIAKAIISIKIIFLYQSVSQTLSLGNGKSFSSFFDKAFFENIGKNSEDLKK